MRTKTVIVLAAIALLFAACSGSETEDSTPTTTISEADNLFPHPYDANYPQPVPAGPPAEDPTLPTWIPPLSNIVYSHDSNIVELQYWAPKPGCVKFNGATAAEAPERIDLLVLLSPYEDPAADCMPIQLANNTNGGAVVYSTTLTLQEPVGFRSLIPAPPELPVGLDGRTINPSAPEELPSENPSQPNEQIVIEDEIPGDL